MASTSVRYLKTFAVVIRGQEERNPMLMAARSVALVGEKRVSCMNFIACWEHFVVWTIGVALSLHCCWHWFWAMKVWVSRYRRQLLCCILCKITVLLYITMSFFAKVTVLPASQKCPIESME